jgi:hypothetical protein
MHFSKGKLHINFVDLKRIFTYNFEVQRLVRTEYGKKEYHCL